MLMQFDGKVTVGDIGTWITLGLAAISMWTRISERLAKLEEKLERVGKWVDRCESGLCVAFRRTTEGD